MLPGRPLTPSRLRERVRELGLRAQPARRATVTDLSAQIPAADLADLLSLAPTTAVNWVRDEGGDWSRYARATANRPQTPTLLAANVRSWSVLTVPYG